MGFFSDIFSRPVGTALGGLAGGLVGQKDLGSKIGGDIGGAVAHLIPFKTGGHVKKTGAALVHKGEFVLPAGVRPTKSQLKAVARRKRMI